MPERIRQVCVGVGQPEPAGHGAVVRCIVDSLALKYRYTIELLARVAGVVPAEVHVVGGGARNELLCQSVADATGLPLMLAQRIVAQFQQYKRRIASIPPDPGRTGEHDKLAALMGRLKQQNTAFDEIGNKGKSLYVCNDLLTAAKDNLYRKLCCKAEYLFRVMERRW